MESPRVGDSLVQAVSRFIVRLGTTNCNLMALGDGAAAESYQDKSTVQQRHLLLYHYLLFSALMAKLLHQYEGFLLCVFVIYGGHCGEIQPRYLGT